MPERPNLNIRMEPTMQRRLDALCDKLGVNRTAALQLAVARLAEAEGVEAELRRKHERAADAE
jgi:predicted transcriptional regulator